MKDILAEHALARPLKQADINRFIADGIRPESLARSWFGDFAFLGRERVAFEQGTDRFEFERHQPDGAVNAFTLLAFDLFGEPADIFAFRPGKQGLWLGRVAMLGAEQVFAPRVDETLDVHVGVLDWLAAERRGIVILDHAMAAPDLRLAAPLRVSTVEHGKQLRHALTMEAPRIVVRLDPADAFTQYSRFAAQSHGIDAA